MSLTRTSIVLDLDDFITLKQCGVNISEICQYALRHAARKIRRGTIVIPDAPAAGELG